jgi:hypothetical protein
MDANWKKKRSEGQARQGKARDGKTSGRGRVETGATVPPYRGLSEAGFRAACRPVPCRASLDPIGIIGICQSDTTQHKRIHFAML